MKTEINSMVIVHLCLLLLLVMLSGCSGPASNRVGAGTDNEFRWSVDPRLYGKPPVESSIVKGNWEVWADVVGAGEQYVLCQSGYADYAAIILNDTVYGDVTITTFFKPVSGKKDQASGILFRVQDKNNYYVLKADARNNKLGIYKYVMGHISLIEEVPAKIPAGTWQELSVETKGNRFRGFLNGKQLLDTQDASFTSGKVGLWTKSDSVSCFHEVRLLLR